MLWMTDQPRFRLHSSQKQKLEVRAQSTHQTVTQNSLLSEFHCNHNPSSHPPDRLQPRRSAHYPLDPSRIQLPEFLINTHDLAYRFYDGGRDMVSMQAASSVQISLLHPHLHRRDHRC